MRIDLNADVGESFGVWKMGNDGSLLQIVTSANVACGFHASDANMMGTTIALAVRQGVGIGAHPGFADLQGFGRRRIRPSVAELGNMVAYQLGAAQGMARRAGGHVWHLKLHGALSNIASEVPEVAQACFEAALALDPKIILVVLAATPMEAAARALGARVACEIFADRAYNDDAALLDRNRPGAVLHDPVAAGPRIEAMLPPVRSSPRTAGTFPVLSTPSAFMATAPKPWRVRSAPICQAPTSPCAGSARLQRQNCRPGPARQAHCRAAQSASC